MEKDGRHYVISHLLDLESVLAKDRETGKSEVIHINDITPVSNLTAIEEAGGADLSLIEQDAWGEAEEWHERLRPFLSDEHLTVKKVREVAKDAGVHVATIYRKLDRLRRHAKVSALVKEKPDGGKGKGRLAPEVEEVIKSTIGEFHFNKEKKKRTKTETIGEIKRRLRNANLKLPHNNTLYNRINAEKKKRSNQSSGGTQADDGVRPTPSQSLGADFPLAVVQIDHTLLDVVVVDDVYHLPVGRPWITVAIDVFSRVVLGFYISLDPPGNTGTGQCIAHAILRKEKWLADRDISVPWPCWGVMDKIHADNAGEFRGDMLKRACKEYGIDLEWRPVKNPRYGAHIERLIGTILNKVHSLPGSTFSNPDERGEYNSEKHAVMTMLALEKWLALEITGDYHQNYHAAILTSPIKRYERGIFGTDEILGRGFPLQVRDEDRLRLDLLPAVERTVQEYGVTLDVISYNGGVLRRWENAKDPDNPKAKRKFLFKRDPRDISVIYFYDPEIKQYFRIPYRDSAHPPMSIWEYRKIRRHLEAQGRKDVDERLIFDTLEQMRAVVEEAARVSKAARREEQRRRAHRQVSRPKTADADATDKAGSSQPDVPDELADVEPFDEIDN